MNKKYIYLYIIATILFITGSILIRTGLDIDIPSRTFSFYTIKEYVGGDAYNAIIEAAIRGGEISAAIITQAIYICSGIITMSISFVTMTIIIISYKNSKLPDNELSKKPADQETKIIKKKRNKKDYLPLVIIATAFLLIGITLTFSEGTAGASAFMMIISAILYIVYAFFIYDF